MAFDFKGNLLASERQLATTYQTSPDWSPLDGISDVAALLAAAASELEPESYSQSTEYDALNRPTTVKKPDGSEILPGYDEGGHLATLAARLRGSAAATPFVTAITYNERGQRNYITLRQQRTHYLPLRREDLPPHKVN